MDDGDQSALQRRGVVDEGTQIQVLRERYRGTVFAPGAVDLGEAFEFEDEDFGGGGEARVLHVFCGLETGAAVSDGADVVQVSVGAV